MKELSIEEKAKAYDEALERAKNFIENGDERERTIAESIFAGLMEVSEDEKIRKELLAWLKSRDGQILPIDRYNAAIAWLEKQGEHANFRNKIQIGDKVTRNEDGELVNLSQLKRVAKPAEEYNITGIGSKNTQGKLGEMIKNLKPVNEVLEQKSAWSEEDETTKNNISHIIRQYDKISKRENKPCWYIGDCLLWMQNIKDRVQSQNTWKPSDEQMEALQNAIGFVGELTTRGCCLKELKAQLEKLREE